MRAEKQSNYALRNTGNYFDLIEGNNYHLQPISFHEFLSKPESLFMYEETFMQIPGYIQAGADLGEIEESARQWVVNYIMNEFEHNLLGMQDYVRWATLFEHKCASLAPAFWAQVNMHDVMFAFELETDQNAFSRENTGNTSRLGTQTSTTDQQANSKTTGKTKSSQDTGNTQTTDTSTREATASVIHAEDQLTEDIDYNWSDAADNVHEIRSRNGDTKQHSESETESESETNSTSHSVSAHDTTNSMEENVIRSNETQDLTNKQFIQERQWAIATAQQLIPLEWLRQNLRPMFYLLY